MSIERRSSKPSTSKERGLETPRQLEHLLGAGRERDLPGRDLVALADDARDLGAHLLDRDVERLEHARGEPLLLAQQPEQDVLRPDVVVLESPRLVLCKDDDLTRILGKALEHAPSLAAPLRGFDIEDLVLQSPAARRRHLDGFALFLADDRLADR